MQAYKIKSLLFSTLIVFSFAQLSSAKASGGAVRGKTDAGVIWTIPDDSKTMSLLTNKARLTVIPTEFEILVWNAHKGADKEAWAQDLRSLSKNSELVLIQEGMKDSFMPAALESLGAVTSVMATSFLYESNREETGVISVSKVQPREVGFRRSPDREPLTGTPKMSLWMKITRVGSSDLLIVNTHAINFVGQGKFENQIIDMLSVVQAHSGPVVWAGDFNTWSVPRKTFLTEELEKAGFQEVIPDSFHGKSQGFDHIFTRGCDQGSAEIFENIKSSDHSPLRAKLHCL